MPSTRPAARSSALRARAQARLDRLAEGVTSDFGIAGAIAAKAAPLRAVCRALGLAFDGWTIREIEEEIGRGLTGAEVRAVAEEYAAAAAFRRDLAEEAARIAEEAASRRREEAAWLAAMA